MFAAERYTGKSDAHGKFFDFPLRYLVDIIAYGFKRKVILPNPVDQRRMDGIKYVF